MPPHLLQWHRLSQGVLIGSCDCSIRRARERSTCTGYVDWIEAFSKFINDIKVTPNQIEFINLIVPELTQTGVMETARLFESPFTDLNAQGPMGLFPAAAVTQIVDVLVSIRATAIE